MNNIRNNRIKLLSHDGKYSVYTDERKYIDISIDNFPNICRFCLMGSSEVKLLSGEEDNLLFKQCTSVLSILIQANDGLPLNICKQCEFKILEFGEFKQSVWEVQKILTNIVEKVAQQNNTSDEHSNDEIKEHNENKYLEKKYRCRFCEETFNKLTDYRNHLKIEREKRKDNFSLCTICKKLFTKGKLIVHMKIHTKIKKEQNYQCDMCGKNYRTKRNLNRHFLIHTGMPHVCDVCGKGFREANLLRDHLNTHTGLTPHLCNICGSSYPTSSALRLHKAYKHSGKKRKIYNYPKKAESKTTPKTKKNNSFPCEICGKAYASKATVNYHVLTHSDERNFQCIDCGKMFANKSILGDHRRIHRLSYKCTYCERSFAYAASLETHINSHTGEKPHGCNFCGKKYSNKSHLKEHIRNHTGERPYSCEICGKRFAAKGNFNGHIKTHKKEHANDG